MRNDLFPFGIREPEKRQRAVMRIQVSFVFILILALFLSGCFQPLQADRNTLRLVTLAEPRNFDPYLEQPLALKRWSKLVFDGLWGVNEKGEPEENLAYLPELSNDAKEIKVRLKDGVKWHDGKSLTAKDVEFTWKLLTGKLDPQYQPSVYDAYYYIDKVTVIDQKQLIFQLNQPCNQFAYLFPAVLPQHILGKEKNIAISSFWFKPVGTGPYRLANWKLGESMTFEANEDYFKGSPEIKKIVVRQVFSPSEATKLVRDGEVDLWQDIFSDEAGALKKDKIDVGKYAVGWESIFFNMSNQVVQNGDLRKAVIYGLDWGKARQFMRKNEASLFGVPPLASYQDLIGRYEVKQDKGFAVEALGRQGYKTVGHGGLREKKKDETFKPQLCYDSRFQFYGRNRYRLFLQVLRQEAESVGIDLIINLPTSRMLSAPAEKSGNISTGNFELLYFAQVFYPHPLLRKPFTAAEKPDQRRDGINLAFYSSPQTEKNYRLAEEASNLKQAKAFLDQVYQEIFSHGVIVPMGYTYYYYYQSDRLIGYNPPIFWESSFQRVEDWKLR